MTTHNAPSPNGRDAGGRFAKGWKGGPGNPRGATVEKFRHALLGAVTESDISDIARALIEQAKGGDIQAVKELLNRVLGRPTDGDVLERVERLERALTGSDVETPQ